MQSSSTTTSIIVSLVGANAIPVGAATYMVCLLALAYAFSFITKLPRELDIMDKIDYDTQFTKAFVEPLRFIAEKMNWLIDDSYGTQGTLEDFFS